MIKTLRITTIIAAVSAVIFLVLSVIFGRHGNDTVEQFLDSSGVVEKYNMGAEYSAKANEGLVPPLVTQAETFVQYLNPPPKPEPTMPEAPKPAFASPQPRSPVTAKFSLVGTSVHTTRPELSLAFINEPGKGLRWVRQGGQVEHLTIKEVKDGLVVVQDGQRTFQVMAPQKPEISLVESSPPVSSEVRDTIRSRADVTASREPDAATTVSTPAQPSLDQNALERFIESLQAEAESSEIDPQNVDKFISVLGSMRISDDEAEKLQRLPKEQLSPEPTTEENSPQQPPAPRTPSVDYKERISRLRSATDETAEPNQVRSPKVRRPVRLPSRQRRNR